MTGFLLVCADRTSWVCHLFRFFWCGRRYRLNRPTCRPSGTGAELLSVRRALTMLVLAMLLLQLGPACGFGNAGAMDSMQCCQSKCPARSSPMPANCCRISASSDKAKPAVGPAPQPTLACVIRHLVPVGLLRNADLSLVTYRSAAPPPSRMRLDLLCSRQI